MTFPTTVLRLSAGTFTSPYLRLILGATVTAFGAIFIVASGENTATTTFFRCLLALPILGAMAIPELRRHGRLSKRSTVIYLAGGTMVGIDFALWAHSISLIGVGIATVATNVHVLVAPVLAAATRRGRLGIPYVLTVPFMLVGVAMAGNVFGSARSSVSLAGLVSAIAAGAAYGVFVFLGGAAPRGRHIALPALLTTATCGPVGAGVGSVFGSVNTSPNPVSLGWMLAYALYGQVLGMILIAPTLARVTASVGASLLLLNPIIVLGLGVLLLGEVVAPIQLAGAALVMGSVFVATVVTKTPDAPNGGAAARSCADLVAPTGDAAIRWSRLARLAGRVGIRRRRFVGHRIQGPELMETLRKQAEHFGAKLVTTDDSAVDLAGEVKTDIADEHRHQAKAVILAMGSARRSLGMPNEERLSDRGVSRCATCDGFRWNAVAEDVVGTERVDGLVVRDTLADQRSTLPVTGVFIAIGHDPRNELVREQVALDDAGYVVTEGPSSRTDIPGVFACGDLVDHNYRQAITAPGSGCIAALDVERYLTDVEDTNQERRALGPSGRPVCADRTWLK